MASMRPQRNAAENVGSEQPPPHAGMRSAERRCSKDSVSVGVSSRHQGGKDAVSPSQPDRRRVLQEEKLRTNRIEDSEDFPYQSRARSIEAGAPAGGGNILAREARMDEIHSSGPGSRVPLPDVGMDDGEVWEPIGSMSRERVTAISILINGNHGVESQKPVRKQRAADSCEQMCGFHFR